MGLDPDFLRTCPNLGNINASALFRLSILVKSRYLNLTFTCSLDVFKDFDNF